MSENWIREVFFACRHHVYELVLKTEFQGKTKQATTSPDIPHFKKLKDNWKNVDLTNTVLQRNSSTVPNRPRT